MQKTDRTDSTESINSLVILNVPPNGVDLRRIFLAIRAHIPYRKLIFSSTTRADVFIPTLKHKFVLIPHKDYLIVKARKKIKLPMIMDGPVLDVKIIDILVAWLEHIGINEKIKHEPLPIHERNDH